MDRYLATEDRVIIIKIKIKKIIIKTFIVPGFELNVLHPLSYFKPHNLVGYV